MKGFFMAFGISKVLTKKTIIFSLGTNFVAGLNKCLKMFLQM
jgi:hypothetical protein